MQTALLLPRVRVRVHALIQVQSSQLPLSLALQVAVLVPHSQLIRPKWSWWPFGEVNLDPLDLLDIDNKSNQDLRSPFQANPRESCQSLLGHCAIDTGFGDAAGSGSARLRRIWPHLVGWWCRTQSGTTRSPTSDAQSRASAISSCPTRYVLRLANFPPAHHAHDAVSLLR
eukprot:1743476-Rhodomonas_salina.1